MRACGDTDPRFQTRPRRAYTTTHIYPVLLLHKQLQSPLFLSTPSQGTSFRSCRDRPGPRKHPQRAKQRTALFLLAALTQLIRNDATPYDHILAKVPQTPRASKGSNGATIGSTQCSCTHLWVSAARGYALFGRGDGRRADDLHPRAGGWAGVGIEGGYHARLLRHTTRPGGGKHRDAFRGSGCDEGGEGDKLHHDHGAGNGERGCGGRGTGDEKPWAENLECVSLYYFHFFKVISSLNLT